MYRTRVQVLGLYPVDSWRAIPSTSTTTMSMIRTISIVIWRCCPECHCSSYLPIILLILIRIVGRVSTQWQWPFSCSAVNVAVVFIHRGYGWLLCVGEDRDVGSGQADSSGYLCASGRVDRSRRSVLGKSCAAAPFFARISLVIPNLLVSNLPIASCTKNLNDTCEC